ncbi:hypothetical protein SDC9_135759 [bioreactor metagenome]|uniref:Uncharacterized protein n=1 Tax=bioreactor metagenome TaxID=1076179 RepID=A0A645DHG8_9ZZZZ
MPTLKMIAIHGPMISPGMPVTSCMELYEEPMEPKEMDQECPIKQDATATKGSKPITTIMGATTATGIPNPANPCSIEAKHQAKSRIMMRRFSETPVMVLPMTLMAPAPSATLYRNTAPQMIKSTYKLRLKPLLLANAMRRKSVPKNTYAMPKATTHETAPTFDASHLKNKIPLSIPIPGL